MPRKNPLTKEQVLYAMSKSLSNRGAARYLNVSMEFYRKYAKLYFDEDENITLWDKHSNKSGKDIHKLPAKGSKTPTLLDIVEGRAGIRWWKPEYLKQRLILEGHIMYECAICGFKETRVIDSKAPLLLRYKDGNRENLKRENVDLLCYNCYFLNIGDIFTRKQELQIDASIIPAQEQIEGWELDDYHKERLIEIGIEEKENGTLINGFDIVARK